MLEIYNYNNIIHNPAVKVSSEVLTSLKNTSKLNYINEGWFVKFSITQLIKNHAHLGGAVDEIADTSYWFLASKKNNFIFINMQFTLIGLRSAFLAVKNTVRYYQKFAFVNNDVTSWGYTTEFADQACEPSFIYRWVGGAFTNIKKLWPMYWSMLADKDWKKLTRRQCFIKMSLNGYSLTRSIPKLVFFNTIKHSVNAAAEAHAMLIGSFGLLDVDAHSVDPTVYLPSNDDSGITLSYYNAIFCKLILKEKYRVVQNFVAKKRLLRSLQGHVIFNRTLRKHMKTRAMLEVHHAKNKWLHPVIWTAVKYSRRLFSFKMFPNIWDKSIVHKIFKSFKSIRFSYFDGYAKYSRAVKEYEKKILRFYKPYLNTLFKYNENTMQLGGIHKSLYTKYLGARHYYYINLINTYKKFSKIYADMLFVYKWMFDLEVKWYGPSSPTLFVKYKRFLNKSVKEINELKKYLKIYRTKLSQIRLFKKNTIFVKKNKISFFKKYSNLSTKFKIEDTWGDQFMPTKFKVLKLPSKKKIKKTFFFSKKKFKKSNPKHSLFMRQSHYKYSSKIWELRKRPWLPVKNPIYYMKEPRFFYSKNDLKRSESHYQGKNIKKRSELYLNNFLPSYFKLLKNKKIKFEDSFLFPNSFYNIIPKRYTVYSIYLSSRFNSNLWFLLLQYLKKKKAQQNIKTVSLKLKENFDLEPSMLKNIIYPVLSRKRKKLKFTITNIYNNYIKIEAPVNGLSLWESRDERAEYFEHVKLLTEYFNISSKILLEVLPTNLLVLFLNTNSIFQTINYFSLHFLFSRKKAIITKTVWRNLQVYLKSIFKWKLNYNYKQIIRRFSKANQFLNKLHNINSVNNTIVKPNVVYTSKDNIIKIFQNKISVYNAFIKNNYIIQTLFFPRKVLTLTQHKYFLTLKNIWPTKKKINLTRLPESTQPQKSFYQMWLDRQDQRKSNQTILDRDISFYLKKKQLFSTLIKKNYSSIINNFEFEGIDKKISNLKNQNNFIQGSFNWKPYNRSSHRQTMHKKKKINFRRRGNFNYRNKKFNPRFEKQKYFYVRQRVKYLRKRRQAFFRPIFSMKDRSLGYIDSNFKNILKLKSKITTNHFYFLLIRFLNKLKNFKQKNNINFYYILLIFSYKIFQQKAFYSLNFINFIFKLIEFLTNKLQINLNNNLNLFNNKLKEINSQLTFNMKKPTKSNFIFRYNYFLDPYIKHYLWPNDSSLYKKSIFINIFRKKPNFFFKHYSLQEQMQENVIQKAAEFFGQKFKRTNLDTESTLFLAQASRIDRQFYYVYGKEKYKTWFNERLMLNPIVRLSARNLLQSVLYRYNTKIKTSQQKIKNRKVLKEILLRFQNLKHKRETSLQEAIFNNFMDRASAVDDYFVDKHITPELFMIRNLGVKVFLKRDWWRFFDSSHFLMWLIRKPWVSWDVEYEMKATLRWFHNNTIYFRFV